MTRPKTTGKFADRDQLERFVTQQFAFGLTRDRIAIKAKVGRTTVDAILRGKSRTDYRKQVHDCAKAFLFRFNEAFPLDQFPANTETSPTLRKLFEARDQLRKNLR